MEIESTTSVARLPGPAALKLSVILDAGRVRPANALERLNSVFSEPGQGVVMPRSTHAMQPIRFRRDRWFHFRLLMLCGTA